MHYRHRVENHVAADNGVSHVYSGSIRGKRTEVRFSPINWRTKQAHVDLHYINRGNELFSEVLRLSGDSTADVHIIVKINMTDERFFDVSSFYRRHGQTELVCDIQPSSNVLISFAREKWEREEKKIELYRKRNEIERERQTKRWADGSRREEKGRRLSLISHIVRETQSSRNRDKM